MRNIQNLQIKQYIRLYLTLVLLGLMLILSPDAGASHPVTRSIDFEGVVIDGYDVVAYFTMADAVKGSKDISANWLGGKWLFVNTDHRDMFLADPAKYIPQYGGYCSSGTSPVGHSDINPKAWQLVDNQLYLFYNTGSVGQWISDFFGKEVAAEKKWDKAKPGLLQQ